MTDKVNELAGHMEDALLSIGELTNYPGRLKARDIKEVKAALEKAMDAVDEMQATESDVEVP
jgi:hypothetical protein